MVRIQVQLTDDQLKALRRLSASSGDSIAELIRRAIDDYVAGRRLTNSEERLERALRVAGQFSSGARDISKDHDRYLAESHRA